MHEHIKIACERHKIAHERLSWYKVQISYNQIAGSEAAQVVKQCARGLLFSMTTESLSLGSLTTRNLIGTNLPFVSEQMFTLNFVTLTSNFLGSRAILWRSRAIFYVHTQFYDAHKQFFNGTNLQFDLECPNKNIYWNYAP